MMFDALIEFLILNNYQVGVVNLTSRYSNIQVGQFSVKRSWEYLFIILKSIVECFKQRGSLLYLSTAQSKSGFLRDLVFINLASFLNCKILLHQFGSSMGIFYNSLSPLMKLLVRNTFSKGNLIIVEGELTKNQFSMIEGYENKVITITNGLPERKLQNPDIGKTYQSDQIFNLIYLNYMIESKGYWDVLKAIRILVENHANNVHCVFAGMFKHSVDDETYANEKDASNAFHQYINKHNLQSYITYYEGLMGDAKAKAFLKAHAFLLPTYFKFEGQPVSVLEAMAYGSVPIVTNHRMIPDMVTRDVGLFVDAKSPGQIAEKVLFLMNNPAAYAAFSQASVNRFREHYTLDKYCNNVMAVINKLMK